MVRASMLVVGAGAALASGTALETATGHSGTPAHALWLFSV